ncbi:hypothetical protein QR680_015970 [Steinernema hermaphroditum]|uniref:Potassium channel domain-containing protein n=1 Tax=Steinernema hermaphroditum TaxID=289476 RepID=A0AA39HC52_9BILA|nr:hypothetical protein QR680_015970 [Steinernema hermaphroditum]
MGIISSDKRQLQDNRSMISQYNQRTNIKLRKAKPFTLHCSLLLVVFIYAFLGGLVFTRLESTALERQKKDQFQEKLNCASRILKSSKSKIDINRTVESIVKCWATEKDERSEWGYMTAWLYGFGICTTLGYNRIAPITTKGRLFCMLYGVIGIPMTMIIIANVGQYLREFAGNWRKKIEIYRSRRRESKIEEGEVKNVEDASIEYVSIVLLLVFSAYIALGAWLLPLLNGQIDFINGLYYNFLCLTAMDFGQLAPQKVAFLPITFIYVCFGLAITTIAIEVGSEYMKKLHYLGQRVKSVATTKIWFGSKHLKVRELLHAVGRKCGVEPEVIDGLDLENVVERAIAINEGREPPEDTNDEYPPQEPQPKSPSLHQNCQRGPTTPPREPSPPPKRPIIIKHVEPSPVQTRKFSIKRAILRTVSDHTVLGAEICPFDPRLDNCKICPIDVSPSPQEEEAIGWEAPIVVAMTNETIVPIEEMLTVRTSLPVVRLDQPKSEVCIFIEPEQEDEEKAEEKPSPRRVRARSLSPQNDEKIPKNFEEKKQMYGRDSKKLLETYQEEWNRIARRSGDGLYDTRRRSVMHSSTSNLSGSQKPDPYDV